MFLLPRWIFTARGLVAGLLLTACLLAAAATWSAIAWASARRETRSARVPADSGSTTFPGLPHPPETTKRFLARVAAT